MPSRRDLIASSLAASLVPITANAQQSTDLRLLWDVAGGATTEAQAALVALRGRESSRYGGGFDIDPALCPRTTGRDCRNPACNDRADGRERSVRVNALARKAPRIRTECSFH